MTADRAELAKLLMRLELATTASCTCRTFRSGHEIEEHTRNCRYRLLASAAVAIRRLMADLGAKTCICALSHESCIVTSTTCCEVCDMFEEVTNAKRSAKTTDGENRKSVLGGEGRPDGQSEKQACAGQVADQQGGA